MSDLAAHKESSGRSAQRAKKEAFMFQIKNLNISHRKDLRPIISGLSLTLNDRDKAAIIGEEGNGKSILLKWLCDPASIES